VRELSLNKNAIIHHHSLENLIFCYSTRIVRMGATKSLLSYHDYIPDTSSMDTGMKSSMEGPMNTDEASIPTEPERMSMSGTTTVEIRPDRERRAGGALKRKAAKRTCVTKLTAANIKSSPEEDIPARKKPRLQVQASLAAITAKADMNALNASPDAGVAAPAASADAGRYPMSASPMKPNNVGAARAPLRRWTPEEDTKLTSAVNTTCKKKHHGEYRTDWAAISELVPGRTRSQCNKRWHNGLDPQNETITCKAKWTKEEDAKLTDSVKKHNGNNWASIASLVPGRTKSQCTGRWQKILDSQENETAPCKVKWSKEEDAKLTDAVVTRKGEDWAAIAALVPGRTKNQCTCRWHNVLDPQNETITCKAKWTKEEDVKLTDSVKKHNGKDWAAISALVPGRTKKQCTSRWHDVLISESDDTNARVGKWTTEEDGKLKDAVEKHNGEDWAAISELVPGRSKQQIKKRWHYILDSKCDETTAHAGRWTKEEDSMLKDAVEKHNGEDWAAISELVPGRTRFQCNKRWHSALDSKSDVTTAYVGRWTKEEDGKLKDAVPVEKHNGNNAHQNTDPIIGLLLPR
jgi:hypothetical protein